MKNKGENRRFNTRGAYSRNKGNSVRGVAPIGDYLKNFMDASSNKKLKIGIEKVQVQEAWHKVMGKSISNNTTDIYLDRTTLYVKISSAPLRQELDYGKEKILEMINAELEKELVKKVVLC